MSTDPPCSIWILNCLFWPFSQGSKFQILGPRTLCSGSPFHHPLANISRFLDFIDTKKKDLVVTYCLAILPHSRIPQLFLYRYIACQQLAIHLAAPCARLCKVKQGQASIMPSS